MITGNRGEWSEIYVLFKLLADGVIYAGDGNLNRLPALHYPILKVLRQEKPLEYEYVLDGDAVHIAEANNGRPQVTLTRETFEAGAKLLLKTIQSTGGTFACEEAESLMVAVNCSTLKAKSTDKADIKLVVQDEKSRLATSLGFSIKSQLGAASTLVNAGVTTNFIFRLKGLDLSRREITAMNNLSVKELVKEVLLQGGRFAYAGMANAVFESNLTLVDSKLPELLAQLLLEYYSSSVSRVTDLVKGVTSRNPLKYDLSHGHDFYAYKVKKYLAEAALGMRPGFVWDGFYNASGGYIIVKDCGELLCYPAYHRNTLEDYLFANTKLDTASTSKHKFGKLYEVDGEVYLDLNLQVRFIK